LYAEEVTNSNSTHIPAVSNKTAGRD